MTWLAASREHGMLSSEIAQNVPRPHPDLGPKTGTPLSRREIRVSEMEMCQRLLAYSWRGVTETNPFSAIVKEKLEKGNLLQDRVRGLLIPYFSRYWVTAWKPEMLLEYQYGDIFFRGHPDGFLFNWKTGTLVSVLEVKATSDYGFSQCCRSSLSDPDHYSSYYGHQANTYAGMWNAANPKNTVTELTIFVYNVGGKEDKDVGAPYKDFWFAFSKQLFTEDTQRLTEHFLRVEANPDYLPDRPYEQTDWHCTGCRYYDVCYGIRRAVDPAGGVARPGNVATGKLSAASRAVSRRPRATQKGT